MEERPAAAAADEQAGSCSRATPVRVAPRRRTFEWSPRMRDLDVIWARNVPNRRKRRRLCWLVASGRGDDLKLINATIDRCVEELQRGGKLQQTSRTARREHGSDDGNALNDLELHVLLGVVKTLLDMAIRRYRDGGAWDGMSEPERQSKLNEVASIASHYAAGVMMENIAKRTLEMDVNATALNGDVPMDVRFDRETEFWAAAVAKIQCLNEAEAFIRQPADPESGDAEQPRRQPANVRELLLALEEALNELPRAVSDIIRNWDGTLGFRDVCAQVKAALTERNVRAAAALRDGGITNSLENRWPLSGQTYVNASIAIALKSVPPTKPSEAAKHMVPRLQRPAIQTSVYAPNVLFLKILEVLDEKLYPGDVYSLDISGGKEKKRIPCRKAPDTEMVQFEYLAANCFHESSSLSLSQMTAVACDGTNCLKAHKYSTFDFCDGPMYQYSADGLLMIPKERLDTGLTECNPACGCNPKTCRNRVVQNGIKFQFEVYSHPDFGFTLRTLDDIKKGSFIVEYIGEVISQDEAERRGRDQDERLCSYLFDIGYDPNLDNSVDGRNEDTAVVDDRSFCIDAGPKGNVARFANHSCDPNLVGVQVWIESNDPRVPRVGLFAGRDIVAGEDLTYDYKYSTTKPDKASAIRLECKCGAANCRKVLWA